MQHYQRPKLVNQNQRIRGLLLSFPAGGIHPITCRCLSNIYRSACLRTKRSLYSSVHVIHADWAVLIIGNEVVPILSRVGDFRHASPGYSTSTTILSLHVNLFSVSLKREKSFQTYTNPLPTLMNHHAEISKPHASHRRKEGSYLHPFPANAISP